MAETIVSERSLVEAERERTVDTLAPRVFNRRHVLDLDDFSRDEIMKVLETADIMKEILRRPIKKVPTLRGKTVVTLFYEASTRTRVSFEVAAKNLGADTVSVSASTSSVTKGESLVDTLCTLQSLGADAVVMRHSYSGAPYLAARVLKGSVLNAGDGWHAHPTQGLLDAYTMRRHETPKGHLAGAFPFAGRTIPGQQRQPPAKASGVPQAAASSDSRSTG